MTMAAGFLYFRDGAGGAVNAEAVEKFGLSYIFDADTSIESRQVNGDTPSGNKGLVFCNNTRFDRTHTASVELDRQVWRQMPKANGRPELWVGFWTDNKPTPADLQRRTMLAGVQMRLADEQPWQIPVVRAFDDENQHWESRLPVQLDFDQNGNPCRGPVIAKYRKLWDQTTPLADALTGGKTVSDEAVFRAAIDLLQANYVVDLPELVMLGALEHSVEQVAMIAQAACRADELIAWSDSVKKKSNHEPPNTSDTTGGSAA